jgi:hypothetical protein
MLRAGSGDEGFEYGRSMLRPYFVLFVSFVVNTFFPIWLRLSRGGFVAG